MGNSADKFVNLCLNGDENGVKEALQGGVNVNSQDSAGRTGLMLAMHKSHNSIVQLLLQQPDVDLSIKGPWGSTVLHWAYKNSNSVGLSLLLAHPTANPNIGNDAGIIPIEHYRYN